MGKEKLVPELRFPEFNKNWEVKKLGNIANFHDGERIPLSQSDREKRNGIYPYYGASGIIDYIDDYIFEGEYVLLGEDGANIIMRNSPLAFVINGKNWVNNHAHVLKSKTNNKFLAESLERISYDRYNTGTAQPKLNSTVCKKIELKYPKDSNEQQKIASFLSAVDKRIELLEKKKELLEQYKKGVMQQIFSQEIRFKPARPAGGDENGDEFPDWEEKKLGEVVEINKGTQLNSEFLTDEGKYPCLNGGVNPSGYTENYNRKGGLVTISEGGNSCGYVNFMNVDFWCGGHCYTLELKNDKILNDWLFQFLKFYEKKIMRLRVGSGLPNIQKKDLLKFNLNTPSIDEQKLLGDFLGRIQKQEEDLEKIIQETKSFKKGLLQKMFV